MTDMRAIRRDSRRRAAMWWMLREAGVSYTAIARAVGITPPAVPSVVEACERRIERRIRGPGYLIEPWAKRLRAAGAIP